MCSLRCVIRQSFHISNQIILVLITGAGMRRHYPQQAIFFEAFASILKLKVDARMSIELYTISDSSERPYKTSAHRTTC